MTAIATKFAPLYGCISMDDFEHGLLELQLLLLLLLLIITIVVTIITNSLTIIITLLT